MTTNITSIVYASKKIDNSKHTLIPLAIKAGDGLIIPAVFAFATGLPVIMFSFILVYNISKLSNIMNKVHTFEKWVRKIVGIVFIVVGLDYILNQFGIF